VTIKTKREYGKSITICVFNLFPMPNYYTRDNENIGKLRYYNVPILKNYKSTRFSATKQKSSLPT